MTFIIGGQIRPISHVVLGFYCVINKIKIILVDAQRKSKLETSLDTSCPQQLFLNPKLGQF